MKKLLFFVLLSCVYLNSYAQQWNYLENNDVYGIAVKNSDYDSKKDGISQKRWIFRYENHTDSEITLTFNREVKYEADFQLQEQHYEVKIPAQSFVEYNDSNMFDKTFYLFVQDNNGFIKRALMDFKITNLKTN